MKLRPEFASGHSIGRPSTTATPATPRSKGRTPGHRSEYRSTGASVAPRTTGITQTRSAPHPVRPSPGQDEPKPDRYRSSRDSDHRIWSRWAGSWVLGLLATIGLFLALPFFQLISTVGGPSTDLVSLEMSKAPPPPPPEQKTPPPEEKEEEKNPELKREQPKLTLAQLELALNPGMGDASAGGDFSMDFQVNSMEELEFIFEISEVDRIPRPIFRVAPVFPYEMKQAGISGSVQLLFVCGADGKVKRISVRSSSHREFEQPAMQAIRGWRFEPGMKDGRPVNVRMLIPFNFNVQER